MLYLSSEKSSDSFNFKILSQRQLQDITIIKLHRQSSWWTFGVWSFDKRLSSWAWPVISNVISINFYYVSPNELMVICFLSNVRVHVAIYKGAKEL